MKADCKNMRLVAQFRLEHRDASGEKLFIAGVRETGDQTGGIEAFQIPGQNQPGQKGLTNTPCHVCGYASKIRYKI